jgi:hypothetical protein
LWPFGQFYGHLAYFPPFRYFAHRKNLAKLIHNCSRENRRL